MKPDKKLAELSFQYPNYDKYIEYYVAHRGQKNIPDWPQWCFLPIAGWINIKEQTEKEKSKISDISTFAGLGTWRYSQGVYEFEDEIYDALMASEHNGKIPTELLKNLPEWCPYIALKKNTVHFDSIPIEGFWVYLEYDLSSKKDELRIILNIDDEDSDPIPIIAHLNVETIDAALKSMLDQSIKMLSQSDNELVSNLAKVVQKQKKVLKQIMPLILYLVSEPEDEAPHIKNPSLNYPTLKKTKKGFRLFPARGIRKWKVGEKISETIKKERKLAELGHSKGTKKTPHLRRGHWHGYWYGKKKSKFKIKWIKPTFVGGE